MWCGIAQLPVNASAATQRTTPWSRPIGALLRACRPKQWSKNLLVLAAPGAAGILSHAEVPGKVALAFASFCLISSSTYLFNDVHDRHEDRCNPRKRGRPVASGELSVSLAIASAIVLAIVGLALAAVVRVELAGVEAGYLLLTGSYTLWWRHMAVADIATIASGFVLRALAGGVATDVTLSRWFLIVTSFGALFLVAGKRYAELREGGLPGEGPSAGESLQPDAPDERRGPIARASLEEYSENYLRFVIGLAATVMTAAYCLWAFQRPHNEKFSWYELTIIPFVLWLLRYALLVDRGGGEAPEELVLGDGFLLLMGAAWLVLFVGGVYVAG
jgi:decaprenyl-phosphate phosphoribosyltransferase